MDNETIYATVYAVCRLLGQEKSYEEIQAAINEGIKLYRRSLPPSKG